MIVIAAPSFELFPRVTQVEEYLAIQALVAQSAIETLDVSVLNRPAWPDKAELHSDLVGPALHRPPGELTAVVGGDRFRHSARTATRWPL